MSGADVVFDLSGDGDPHLVGWTQRNTDQAFLAMNRDGDGRVTSGRELFGNFTPLSWTTLGTYAAHGLEALAFFDNRDEGNNADGAISSADAVFGGLRLWIDRDRDGVNQPYENDWNGRRWYWRHLCRWALLGRRPQWAWDVFVVAGR